MTEQTVREIVTSLDAKGAIAPEKWDITATKKAVRACNAYHVVDRAGIYDAFRPFCVVWEAGADPLAFSLDFDGVSNDPAIGALRSYIESSLIDIVLGRMLDVSDLSDLA